MTTRTKSVSTEVTLPPRKLPAAAAAAMRGGGPTAIGWTSPTGPVVLPGSPLGEDGSVEVPALALQVIRAPASSSACLTLDRTQGSRPSHFAGVIFRGQGVVTRGHSGWATVAVHTDRVSWWSGFRTGTFEL